MTEDTMVAEPARFSDRPRPPSAVTLWPLVAYAFATLLVIAIIVRAFWPLYFGRLFSGGVDLPWIVHVHAAVFGGFLVLLLAQMSLAIAGTMHLPGAWGRRAWCTARLC